MTNKFMRVGTLALLQVVIVGNLQILPANAVYGFSLPILYFLAVIFFYLPTVIMTSKLAVQYPQTGGAYIWSERAFGTKMGFVTVSMLWISNLLWYPSIFVLIAANLAYLFNPALAQNRLFVLIVSLIFFWGITILNCLGIRSSIRISIICGVIGVIVPALILIVCGISWLYLGEPIAITLNATPLLPKFNNLQNIGYLIAIVTSLFGIEMMAVHAGNVIQPKRNFPRSLWIASILLILFLLGAELAIAIIVPPAKLNVVTGLLDALVIFFQQLGLAKILYVILLLVFFGNVGSVAAWMLSATRGMYVACERNHVYPFLQKLNRYQAPIGVLIFEAIIFTAASCVFLLFPNVVDSFWLLLDLASQITLIYYIILFIASMRLGCPPFIMLVGALTSLVALLLGFIAPPDLAASQKTLFHIIILLGLIFSIALPIFFLTLNKSKRF